LAPEKNNVYRAGHLQTKTPKSKKKTEMHTVQNYKLSKTKQVY